MLTMVSVVVILGAIIATIARAVLAGDGQPPTTERPRRRGEAAQGPPSADAGERAAEPEPILVPAADLRVEDRAAVPVTLDAATPGWRRLQSIVLLALLVTALGVLAAGLLAVLVIGGASVLDKALG